MRLRIALSIALRWQINSPADHRPSVGLVFHRSAGIASAARIRSPCARARFSIIVASGGKDYLLALRESDSGASGLLESMSQLKHARLSESRSKDLQAHRQLSLDLAARYRDPRNSRQ